MELFKLTFHVDPSTGTVTQAHRTTLQSSEDTLYDAAFADMLIELTTSLKSEGEADETDETRIEHLDTSLFQNDDKNIVIYDGSDLTQIIYISIN